jgi:hypothetical protein
MSTQFRLDQRGFRAAAMVALMLLLGSIAQAQAPASQGQASTADLGARLSAAAQDPSLSAWQRNYMIGLAGSTAATCSDPWTQVTPVGPIPTQRNGHTAMYDPVRNRMIVFGGIESYTHLLNDTWALSLNTMTWQNLNPAGPLPPTVVQHVAIYDPLRDRMIIWGGGNDTHTLYDNTWALSLGASPAWTELATIGTRPAKRFVAAAIYDPIRDRMIVFGGDPGTDPPSPCFNDTWALSFGTLTWTQLSPTGTPPAPRGYVSGIYDPIRDRMLVYGGHDYPSTWFGELWGLSLPSPAWQLLSPTGDLPGPRANYATVYDARGDAMVIYGGNDVSNNFGDTWVLRLGPTAWSRATTSGTLPPARSSTSAVYDPLLKRLVIFGGGNSGGRLNDTWTLGMRNYGIQTVRDVANDQGRSVRINFFAADEDTAGAPAPILQYEAYRRIDSNSTSMVRARTEALASRPISRPTAEMAGWEFAGAVPAHGECEYNMIAPTLADSNASAFVKSTFFIRAATANPTVFYDSPADLGYSVDNLAPAAPTAFVGETQPGGVYLHWTKNLEADLAGYRVYRGFSADFVPDPSNLIASPGNASYSDPEVWATVYYKLSAVDVNGNESGFAAFGNSPIVAVPGADLPSKVWLGRATPNPMRDGCAMRFGLPQAASVSLIILDLQGRRVRLLVAGSLPPGEHVAHWDGRSDSGVPAQPGVYLYRVEVAGRALAERVVRVR